ncbi:Leucine-rich repeat [Kalmanozyma brasiliensis GHG001]|uniref:Uncharacterized protein n=1 Tax=Kalmanozyma brasiliensis (strain GHG001) TaxID=1365824 RepID=V5EDL2_KALBG|nr:Leucine-rich repeat [Kalmanozyma brasiliensis GHG001]EST08536.1 Leucine-rich repeat [Kalmanozyma brasiliensis GHG001]
MDSIPGDQWIGEYARWLRVHEAKLGDAAASIAAAKRTAAAKAGRDAQAPAFSSNFWNVVTLGTATGPAAASDVTKSASTSASSLIARPMLLRQNPHNVFYLLIRFEELGLPTGSLDTKIPIVARPTSYFSFVAASAADKDRDDTMSMSSMRSRMSVVSSSFSSSLSWFSTSSSKPDPSKDLKYIYSCFTKIPSLRLGPIPARKLIQDFEDCPGQSAVPLDVFKNLQTLELDDVDPRTLIGWDRACIQLRSLTCKKSNIEDLTDLLVDLVVVDAKRRRGEKVDLRRLRLPAPTTHAGASASNTASNTDVEDNITETSIEPSSAASTVAEAEATPSISKDLPSLAWHFLRHLNLSNNNLTFVPVEPLLCLAELTSLDLSSNLLNVVPPSLSHLPALTSLNISDNLIDSVLGIYDALPAIRVLNLAKNRLESLCGLERLYSLQRIDLRGNAIYEAGEVGRLAPLPAIAEIWVKDNPLVEELVDYRVDCFVEFAQEGRTVALDGEAPGFFEKQRIAERVPNAAELFALASSNGSRMVSSSASGTTRGKSRADATEEDEAQLARDVATSSRGPVVVKNVRHRAAARPTNDTRGRSELLKVPGSEKAGGQTEDAGASKLGSRSTSREGARGSGPGRRKNQRVIELDSSPRKPTAASTRERTLTDSDRIKHAALSGNSFAAMESPEAASAVAASNGARNAAKEPESPLKEGKMTWTRKGGAAAAQLSAEDSQSNHGSGSASIASATKGKAKSTSQDADVLRAHSTLLLAIPPGLASSSDSNSASSSASRPGQPRTFSSRRNPIDSSTLGRKSAARPLASDLFATSNTGAVSATTNDVSGGTETPAALARERIARPRIGSTAALARRSQVTTSMYDSDLASSSSPLPTSDAPAVRSEPSSSDDKLAAALAENETESSSGTRSDAFRRRIEALKSEVGDDWLRLLARGGGSTADRESLLLAADEAVPAAEEVTRVARSKKTRKPRLTAEESQDSGARRRAAHIT